MDLYSNTHCLVTRVLVLTNLNATSKSHKVNLRKPDCGLSYLTSVYITCLYVCAVSKLIKDVLLLTACDKMFLYLRAILRFL